MPVGATRRAESSTSMPPPEPRSSTTSPSLRSTIASGLPHPSDACSAVSGSSFCSLSTYWLAPKSSACSSVITAASGPQQPAATVGSVVASAAAA